jgi:hypothetical protein
LRAPRPKGDSPELVGYPAVANASYGTIHRSYNGAKDKPRVLELGLPLEAGDIEEPVDTVAWRPGVLTRMAFSERACRSGGIITGQAIMSLDDAAKSFAVLPAMKKFLPIGTVDQTTHFLTSASCCDLIAGARVVRHGRTMNFVHAEVGQLISI